MKTLMVFYSRTGRTRAHMIYLKEALHCEQLIAVHAQNPYKGPIGALQASLEALSGRDAGIDPPSPPLDMSAYDLVVLGTPVWAAHAAPPLCSFIRTYGQGIRRCAHVVTHGGRVAYEKVSDELDRLTGVRRVAALSVSRFNKDLNAEREAFVKTIREALL